MFSFGVQISLTASADLPTFTTRFDVELVGRFNVFSFGGQLYFSSDGKFYSGQSRFYFGYYFDAAQGWLGLNLENLNLKIGKFVEGDVVESPYSLFITSEKIHRQGLALEHYVCTYVMDILMNYSSQFHVVNELLNLYLKIN